MSTLSHYAPKQDSIENMIMFLRVVENVCVEGCLCNWAALKTVLTSCTSHGVELADRFRAVAAGAPSVAFTAAEALMESLLSKDMSNEGPFNVKEVVWSAVLWREAFDHRKPRPAAATFNFRAALWRTSLHGPGGSAGLKERRLVSSKKNPSS